MAAAGWERNMVAVWHNWVVRAEISPSTLSVTNIPITFFVIYFVIVFFDLFLYFPPFPNRTLLSATPASTRPPWRTPPPPTTPPSAAFSTWP